MLFEFSEIEMKRSLNVEQNEGINISTLTTTIFPNISKFIQRNVKSKIFPIIDSLTIKCLSKCS